MSTKVANAAFVFRRMFCLPYRNVCEMVNGMLVRDLSQWWLSGPYIGMYSGSI